MTKDDEYKELYGGEIFGNDNESDEESEGTSSSSSSTPSSIEPPKQDFYSYMADWSNEMPIESDEDYAKRRKRAKNAALFGAISDGISSLANLYATTKYAPSAYNANTPTMTGKVLERYDKMEEERKKDKTAWAQGAQRARQLDEAKADKDRSWKLTLDQWAHQQEKDANQEKRAQADENRKAELHPEQLRAARASADNAENQATISGIQTKYAEEEAKAKIDVLKAQVKAYRSKASGGGSGKNGKEPHIVYDGEGGYIVRSDEKNWESDVKACAEAAGIPLTRVTTKVITNSITGQKTTTETEEDVPVTELNAQLRNKGIAVLKTKAEEAAASGESSSADSGAGGSGGSSGESSGSTEDKGQGY